MQVVKQLWETCPFGSLNNGLMSDRSLYEYKVGGGLNESKVL